MEFNKLLLEYLVKNVEHIYKQSAPVWNDDSVTDHDKTILTNEANEASQFDKFNLKKNTLNTPNISYVVKKCQYGRIVIVTDNKDEFYPWATWGRILQWFGSHYQIYIYSSKQKRILPDQGQVGPEHVNGGYTYACKNDCVVIYRYEEATRVLIHELLHASCTDNMNNSVEVREAATETWAEFILVAILSKGDMNKAKMLWKIQEHHIQDLNYTLYNFYNVKTLEDYASRYTILRENVLKSFGILLDNKYKPTRIKSSRFTSEKLDTYLE